MTADNEQIQAAPPACTDMRDFQRVRILRIALEAIYTQPYITLAEARALALQALEDTE